MFIDRTIYVSPLRFEQIVTALEQANLVDLETKRLSESEYRLGDMVFVSRKEMLDDFGLVISFVNGKSEIVGRLSFTEA